MDQKLLKARERFEKYAGNEKIKWHKEIEDHFVDNVDAKKENCMMENHINNTHALHQVDVFNAFLLWGLFHKVNLKHRSRNGVFHPYPIDFIHAIEGGLFHIRVDVL